MVLPRVDQTQSLSSRVQDTYKNDQIRADVIIVIDEEGVNVGEFTRDKALEYARTL
jgi:translation initiation factor IF-3